MSTVRRLVWDEWNIGHVARHAVTPGEVDEVCRRAPVVLQSYANRLLLIGSTVSQRMLAVVLEPMEQDAYYVITARPASRKERRLYRERKGFVL